MTVTGAAETEVPEPEPDSEPEHTVPDAPTGVEATTTDGSGSVTLSWSNPGDSTIATYEYSLRQREDPPAEWTTIPGSNADTTSVTIDLAPGQWTVNLRARDVNGNAGGLFTTTVTGTEVPTGTEPTPYYTTATGPETPEPGPETVVPALPLAGLVTLALVLFLGGQRQRKRGG